MTLIRRRDQKGEREMWGGRGGEEGGKEREKERKCERERDTFIVLLQCDINEKRHQGRIMGVCIAW